VGYTRNFGFRSFENIVRNARHRVPADAGDGYEIGSAVAVDPSSPGFLTRPGDGAAPTQLSGIAVFEHIQYQGDDPWLTAPQDKQFAPSGQYCQAVHGIGVKVWFRDVGNKTLYDGRTQTNAALLDSIDAGDLDVGAGLVPNADGLWREVDDQADPAEQAWLIVEQVNPSTGVIECRLTF
jgi:hypothetical protein